MFNALPVTAISEMQCNLPCPRKLWDKKDATVQDVEVYRQQKQRSPRYLESLKDLVEKLMGESWDGIDSFPVNAITMSGLELAIFGQYITTYHVPLPNMMANAQQQSAPLLRLHISCP